MRLMSPNLSRRAPTSADGNQSGPTLIVSVLLPRSFARLRCLLRDRFFVALSFRFFSPCIDSSLSSFRRLAGRLLTSDSFLLLLLLVTVTLIVAASLTTLVETFSAAACSSFVDGDDGKDDCTIVVNDCFATGNPINANE